MAKLKTNPKADFFFNKDSQWQEEYEALRSIALATGLKEELKWGTPCYCNEDDGNIVLIHGFKDYCAFLFFKGALLTDVHGLLIQQSPNVQSPRQMRFTSLTEIEESASIIKAYIQEAIEVEKADLKLELKKTDEYHVPDELLNKFRELPALKSAFEALTPGRQRGYLLFFSAPKQSKTRIARIEKYLLHIMEGKGLND